MKILRSLLLSLLALAVLAAPAQAAPVDSDPAKRALEKDSGKVAEQTKSEDDDRSGKGDGTTDDDQGEDDNDDKRDDPAPPAGPDIPPADEAGAPPALGPAGPPVAGERFAAAADSGQVRVRLPGSDAYVPLTAAATVPVGSVVDARAGAVVLRSALPGGRTDRGTFGGGLFEVRQNARDGVTELRLRGGAFERCSLRTLAGAVDGGTTRKPRVVRRLWGRDRGGRFRTHGHNSVATVRGTRWLTEDRCDGTLTRVTEGAVEVRNRRNGRRVLLHAGDSYLAKR